MKKMWIFGDSFASDATNKSWTNLISKDLEVLNLSKNGISEYRIYRMYRDVREQIQPDDIIIFCHTNPNRVYIPNSTDYPTRNKNSHPECDLVLGDVNRHGIVWRFISYIFMKYFYDENYYKDLFDLMIADMNRINCKVIHVSGFESTFPIISFNDIFINYRGNINHLNEEGNVLVSERISKLL